VQALIVFFFQLCLLRRAPQDLPASDTLFGLALTADIASGFLGGIAGGVNPFVGLGESVTEVSMMLALLSVSLRLIGHPARFNQAATALLGAGALIGTLALPAIAMIPSGDSASDIAALGVLLLVGFLCWSILVTGHVLRHTFAINLGQGIGIAVAYQILVILVIDALFG